MLSAVKISDFRWKRKETKIKYLPVDKIRPNPYQPRKYFDKLSLEELSASIKEYGVMQPISVRLINGCSYELVSGERRLRASRMAGLTTIPCIIVNINDMDSAAIALIENLQRQNLNFIEEAEGLQSLMTDYELTAEELAEKLGKKQSTIAAKVRILKLSEYIKRQLVENDLTERHAKALLKIPDKEVQEMILNKIIEQGLNGKRTEELVEATMQKMRRDQDIIMKRREKHCVNDIRLFTNTIKQSIDIIQRTGINATYNVEEKEQCYEIHIQIPHK